MFPSKIFYKHFSGNFSKYSLSKKKYLDSIDNIITSIDFRPKNILDLGAGDGQRSLKIAKEMEIENITLVDDCPEMFNEIAQTKSISKISADISDSDFYLKINKKTDLILCLWNVLGHIEKEERRLKVIKNISEILSAEGVCFLDVNNRYNIKQYGFRNVLKNIFKDMFLLNKENGDFLFNFKKEGVEIKTSVHIFNPHEVDKYIKKAGLEIIDKKFIDYDTGKIHFNMFSGQILYKIKKS